MRTTFFAVTELAQIRWSHDKELARRCVAGERSAQRELYEQEKKRVHATLYRIFGHNRHIEDVLQDVFLQVFRSLDAFRGESSLATWIDRFTVRAAFARLAQGKKRGTELELVPDLPSNDPSVERAAVARDAARRLYVVLDRLEPRQRVAFVLHEIEGSSLAEVADAMEATVIATKARLFRARQRVNEEARKDPVLASFIEGSEP